MAYYSPHGISQFLLNNEKQRVRFLLAHPVDCYFMCSMYRTCLEWIAPVAGNPLKAQCRYCQVQLNAHLTDLRRHVKTSKHARSAAAQRFRETKDEDGQCCVVSSVNCKMKLTRRLKSRGTVLGYPQSKMCN